ncbi:MAG: hypothetical protein GY827_05145 [Cytophagales bacterium]|nr:hypothetical protein [Cytophagales bacterium]
MSSSHDNWPIVDYYKKGASFIPDTNTPIKAIYLNFIFMQKDDGTGNFQEDNPEHQQYIDDIISNLNKIYSSIRGSYDRNCPSYQNIDTPILKDSKVRFLVNKMFIKNSAYWDNQSTPTNKNAQLIPGRRNWFLNDIHDEIVKRKDIPPAINVFFTESAYAYKEIVDNQSCKLGLYSTKAASQFPSFSDLDRSSKVHMQNLFVKYTQLKNKATGVITCDPPAKHPWEKVYEWISGAGGLAHELGHSLDLYHTNKVGTNCVQCIHSVMNNDGCSYRRFLSPLEIGCIHRALALSSIRKYVKKDVFSEAPININSDYLWNKNSKIYRNINVQDSATFTLSCDLILPPQGTVLVTQGSKLIIDNGATIRSTGDDEIIPKIVIKSGGELVIDNATLQNVDIVVEEGGLLSSSSSILKVRR